MIIDQTNIVFALLLLGIAVARINGLPPKIGVPICGGDGQQPIHF